MRIHLKKLFVLSGLLLLLVAWGCTRRPHYKIVTRSLANAVLDASGYAYDPADRSCGGFPRLMVGTMPNTCLGLVLPKSRAQQLVKPRSILQIPGTEDFMVVDMGGWVDYKGGVYLLKKDAAGLYQLQKLRDGLNQPHGFALSRDGFYYIGEKHQISRFRYQAGAISQWQLVLGGLERQAGYMHPLAQFVFDPRNNDLYINSGSPSDHCAVQGAQNVRSCPESEQRGAGAILKISGTSLERLPRGGLRDFTVVANGLRNSMAMAIHPSGTLVQGENSRDFPELEEPYEEINVVDLNQSTVYHYGWPYCYNFFATSPEWLFDDNKKNSIHQLFQSVINCNQTQAKKAGDYQAPHALMPPHVAPLHMAYYQGPMFPELRGQLLVSWHGYQPTGQRLVAYATDERGRPVIQESTEGTYGFNQRGAGVVRRKIRPHGGASRIAPYTEVISQWSAQRDVRPKGAPVGFAEASDGSIFIVEDRSNVTIVRLARSEETYRDPSTDEFRGMSIDPKVELLAWRHHVKSEPQLLGGYLHLQQHLIQNHCLGCHGNMAADDIALDRFKELDFIVKNDWVKGGDRNASKLFGSIAHLPAYTPMPPADKTQFHDTDAGRALIESVGAWVDRLAPDITQTYTRITTGSARRIRARASASATSCGQFLAGDVVYVDPRDSQRPVVDGWLWTKVYLVPGHTRLVPGACPATEDGVYWMALVRR